MRVIQYPTSYTINTGHLIDSATTAADGSQSSLILAEVCKLIVANGITPNANQYYAVYTGS